MQNIIAQRNKKKGENINYKKLSEHEFKIREIEQQVRIYFLRYRACDNIVFFRYIQEHLLIRRPDRNSIAREQSYIGETKIGRNAKDLILGEVECILYWLASHRLKVCIIVIVRQRSSNNACIVEDSFSKRQSECGKAFGCRRFESDRHPCRCQECQPSPQLNFNLIPYSTDCFLVD